MLKIRKSSRTVTPFAGISFVVNELEKAGIPQLIDGSFPKRHGKAKYGYADAILSLVYGTMCGANRLDDYAKLKGKIMDSSINIPSPVSLGRIMRQKLKAPNQKVGRHVINVNTPLNDLLLDIALKLGQLKAGKSYMLDYDNTCLHCEKEDAQFTYKKERGYQPGVCFIGEVPVYIEGMNGNNPAKFDQVNTLSRTFESLENKGIGVRRFRADAASYQRELIDMLEKRKIEFFIRAHNQSAMFNHIMRIKEWRPVRLRDDSFEIAEFAYRPWGNRAYRIIISRRPTDKPHHYTTEKFAYRSIITNCLTMSDIDVIWTYNQRGDIERNFDVLNNDWGWRNLPFSFLSENTAYMLITAMGLVMYRYILETFADRVDWIEDTYRLKRFRYNVISIAGEWKKEALVLYDTSRPWEKLVG